MRRIALMGIVGIWAVFTGSSFAQISTFPAPPPLEPVPKPAPDQPAPNPSGTLAPPPSDVASPAQATNGGSTGIATPTASQAAVAASANAPVSAATLTSMTALDDKVPLQPGDRISFRVLEDQDDAVPRIVTDTGEVDFPYVGRLKVTGKTCRQVAIQLKQLLEVDYYKRATVIVGLDVIVGQSTAAASTHDLVWVIGQVRSVGPQEISKLQPLTVSQIILRAGGFGDFADQRKVKIIHRGANSVVTNNPDSSDVASNSQDTLIVDVKAVYEGESKDDPIVQPNDYIIVPKKFVNF
jgi:protein involved in polysaccharide export with SLBB domain